MPAEGF